MRDGSKIKLAAKAGVILALGVGAGVSIAAPAMAGFGNTVHNCYGIYFTRDWDQRCDSPGAAFAGNYKSVADCTSSGDNSLTVRRGVGSTRSFDGADCTFQVVDVDTSFSS